MTLESANYVAQNLVSVRLSNPVKNRIGALMGKPPQMILEHFLIQLRRWGFRHFDQTPTFQI